MQNLRISRAIPGRIFFSRDFESATQNNSQGLIPVIVACQTIQSRVSALSLLSLFQAGHAQEGEEGGNDSGEESAEESGSGAGGKQNTRSMGWRRRRSEKERWGKEESVRG